MLTFQEEEWWSVREGVLTLAARHWAEMPFDPEIPLSLDHTLYDRLAADGKLHVTTARDGKRLAGYFVSFIGRHPHYDVLTGSMDVYYLAPGCRGGVNAMRLFLAMERLLRARGVRYLLATARLDREKNASRLFERLGWKHARAVYEKKLGD